MSPLFATTGRARMRDIVGIGQRYLRAGGDLVITVRQVHRADGTVEVTVPAWARMFLPDFPREITFAQLADEFELLVPLKGARS